jgi:hypothetical protein
MSTTVKLFDSPMTKIERLSCSNFGQDNRLLSFEIDGNEASRAFNTSLIY